MACSSTGANDRRRNQYDKILNLDGVTSQIAVLAQKHGIDGLAAEADEKFGVIPSGDFMETVDLSQPHMWLSQHTEMAEARYAYVVTRLLEKAPSAMSECQQLIREDGHRNSAKQFHDLEDAYYYFTQNVLDGMPCDKTAIVRAVSDKRIVWQKLEDTHERFWQQAGGNVDNYYVLQQAYVNGLFEESGIRYSDENHELFRLTR